MQRFELFIASAEEVIMVKLKWSRLDHSQRQVEDAAEILKVRGDSLDQKYLENG